MSAPKKEWSKPHPGRNQMLAVFGNSHAFDVVDLVDFAKLSFEMLEGGKYNSEQMNKYGWTREYCDEIRQSVTTELLKNLKGSILEKDGGFFRELADVIEKRGPIDDPFRLWLLAMQSNGRASKLTIAKFAITAQKRGWDVSERRLRTVLDELGIQFKSERIRSGPAKDKLKTR